MFIGPAEIERLKRNAASREQPFVSAWAKVLEAADAALDADVAAAHVHLFELANLRYPGNPLVRQALDTLDRVAYDQEHFGWATVLLYGGDDG